MENYILVALFVSACTPFTYTVPLTTSLSNSDRTYVQEGLDRVFRIEAVSDVSDPTESFKNGNYLKTEDGTGFCIIAETGEKLVITAAHVIKDYDFIFAYTYKTDGDTGKRILINKVNLKVRRIFLQEDIAILEPSNLADEEKLPEVFKIADTDWSPSQNSNYFVFGFQTGWQYTSLMHPSFVMIKGSSVIFFRVEPKATFGDSGAPVLNNKNKVVGILLDINEKKAYSLIEPITFMGLDSY